MLSDKYDYMIAELEAMQLVNRNPARYLREAEKRLADELSKNRNHMTTDPRKTNQIGGN